MRESLDKLGKRNGEMIKYITYVLISKISINSGNPGGRDDLSMKCNMGHSFATTANFHFFLF